MLRRDRLPRRRRRALRPGPNRSPRRTATSSRSIPTSGSSRTRVRARGLPLPSRDRAASLAHRPRALRPVGRQAVPDLRPGVDELRAWTITRDDATRATLLTPPDPGPSANQADARRTNVVGQTMVLPFLPRSPSRRTRSSAAAPVIASSGCRIVVSGGSVSGRSARRRSPRPRRRPGTRRRPRGARAARPTAIRSEAAKTPSMSGRRPSSRAISAVAALLEEVALLDEPLRTGRPAPRARRGSRRAGRSRRTCSSGPAIVAIVRRPRPIRCSTPSRAPPRLSASTNGSAVRPSGRPISTVGTPARSSWRGSGSSPCSDISSTPSTCSGRR